MDQCGRGGECGWCFCATVDGETIADLWGGYADSAQTRPWERDTIVHVYSITKAMAALTALLIVDRGELDFDAPVARYWPQDPFSDEVTDLQDNAAHNPRLDASAVNSRAWRAAEIPAGGGTGNARSVARIHAILANGGTAQGRRFFSEVTCRKALEVHDLILGMGGDFMPSPNTLFWGGAGGSLAIIDMDSTGDMRAFAPISAAWKALAAISDAPGG